jgi:hypothetical protein
MRVAIRAVFAALACSSAHAATMTFNELPQDPSNFVWVEDGITATSERWGLGTHGPAGTSHLDDSGAPFPRSITFTMPGLSFDAAGVDIFGARTAYCANAEETACGDPYNNVLWQGFRDGALVAEASFYALDYSHFTFGSAFKDIDALFVRAMHPGSLGLPGYCSDAPCGHFSIDNVSLAPSAVPIPAAFPLFASALGLGGLFGYRRKRKAALATA